MLLYGTALGLPAAVLAAALLQSRFPIQNLLRDPLVLAMEAGTACCAAHFGTISNLGILLWLSTAAVALFTSVLLAQRGAMAEARFLFLGGSLSLVLGIDDWFMLHEFAFPRIGITETTTMTAYAALGLVYVGCAYRQILRHSFTLFGLAGAFLAGSILSDLVPLHQLPVPAVVIEDGLKLFGISCWTAFHVAAAFSLAKRDLPTLNVSN